MNDFDPSSYGITIRRQAVEGHIYFVGTVLELPDAEVYEDSQEDAYREILNVISSLKAMSDEQSKHFPVPTVPSEDFSGRVTLRLPKSLHRNCAKVSESEGVSLNQYLVSLIAEAIGAKSTTNQNSATIYPLVRPTASVGTSNPLQTNIALIKKSEDAPQTPVFK